eukprot:2627993-Lingulodinium_polyedra.AAC.1
MPRRVLQESPNQQTLAGKWTIEFNAPRVSRGFEHPSRPMGLPWPNYGHKRRLGTFVLVDKGAALGD